MRKHLMIFLLSICLILTSCATTTQNIQKANSSPGEKEKIGIIIGAAGGAVAGAVVGKKVGGKKGEIIGALIGTIVGGFLGQQIGKAFDDRDRRLDEIKRREGVKINHYNYAIFKNEKEKFQFVAKLNETTNEAQRKKICQVKTVYKTIVFSPFKTGSTHLSPKMHRVFLEIARAYKADGIRKVLIISYTDSQGPAEVNQRLSEERAKAVAKVFVEAGYPPSNIYIQGAGESEPIADDSTPEGRAKNRRIVIYDASEVWRLAQAKRYSIVENRATISQTKQISTQHAAAPHRKAKVTAMYLPHCSCIIPFKGTPYNGQRLATFGSRAPKAREMSIWEKFKRALFLPTAQAIASSTIPDFLRDDIKTSGDIKRLDGRKEDIFQIDDYLPPYRKWPIYYMMGNIFLDIKPISILKEKALVNSYPQMSIWIHHGRTQPPDVRLNGAACLYLGNNNKMLFRWKASRASIKRSGILGVDILLPIFQENDFQNAHDEYIDALVYYLKNGEVFVAEEKFIIHVPKRSNIRWRVKDDKRSSYKVAEACWGRRP